MKPARASFLDLFGAAGSLQRKIFVNIFMALLLILPISVAVLIWEFDDHLQDTQREALKNEAQEILSQADPGAPFYGMHVEDMRFRGASGAYRYTLFGPDLTPLAGSEDSPRIRAQIKTLEIGRSREMTLPGERRGVAICGGTPEQKICALASTHIVRIFDDTMLHDVIHEVEEQFWWILVGAIVLLSTATTAARISLRPLLRVRDEARSIGPENPDKRLSSDDLPTEMVPLVAAVNNAFDRLERGYRAQREFSSNVAHEVRTPLAVLHSSVDLVEDETQRNRLRQDLRQLETIFSQLIDLARADALMPEAFGPVPLDALAQRIANDRAAGALRSDKTLAISGAQKVVVTGNIGLLAIALDNLVRNALSYSPPGTEVEIEVTAAPPGFRVLDRGPGVAEHERDALFERFYRGRAAAGNGLGSGLGLAIVKSVAEAHRAATRIESRAGGGSVFILEFPGA